MNPYLVAFCGLLLLGLTVVAWRLDVVSGQRDAANQAVETTTAANASLQTRLQTAEQATRARELRLRDIEASLAADRSSIRKVPTDACIDTPVPAAVADSLRR